jgi:hypothetical protein
MMTANRYFQTEGFSGAKADWGSGMEGELAAALPRDVLRRVAGLDLDGGDGGGIDALTAPAASATLLDIEADLSLRARGIVSAKARYGVLYQVCEVDSEISSLRNRGGGQFERVRNAWRCLAILGTSKLWRHNVIQESLNNLWLGVDSAAAHPLRPCLHLPPWNLHIHPESGKLHYLFAVYHTPNHIT